MVFGVATIIFPISAQSENIPARGAIPFAAYDKDDNGTITEKEFKAAHEKRKANKDAENTPLFSEFDINADGQLTQDELVAGQMAQIEKRLKLGM